MLACSTTSSTTLVTSTILVTSLSLVLFASSSSIGTPLIVGLMATLVVAIIVIILVLIVFTLASALLGVRHLRPTAWHSTFEGHAGLLERGL